MKALAEGADEVASHCDSTSTASAEYLFVYETVLVVGVDPSL